MLRLSHDLRPPVEGGVPAASLSTSAAAAGVGVGVAGDGAEAADASGAPSAFFRRAIGYLTN